VDGVTPLPNCEVLIGNVYDSVSADGYFSANIPAGDNTVSVIFNSSTVAVQNVVIIAGQDNTVSVVTNNSITFL